MSERRAEAGPLRALVRAMFEQCGMGGDDEINGNESCDGSATYDATCRSLGFTAGSLACSNSCNFDVTNCTLCGDGIVEGNETCDDGADNGRYGFCNAT